MDAEEIARQTVKAITATLESTLFEVLTRSPHKAHKITLNLAPAERNGRRKWNAEASERTDYTFEPTP